VLVVWGERDPRVPLATVVDRIATLPRRQLKIFRRSGHLPFLEEPSRFNRLAAGFLNAGGVQEPGARSTQSVHS
jgi:pimeloyl-ACP methyl ester carboxylesterase